VLTEERVDDIGARVEHTPTKSKTSGSRDWGVKVKC
jgi:hypothetical protein